MFIKEVLEGLAMIIATLIAFFVGLCIVFTLYSFSFDALAEEPFIGFGLDVEHHKHRSMLCNSGGMSRNLTYTLKAMAGYESNDVRYYLFYSNSACPAGGDTFTERSNYVMKRDETIGVSFEWKTNL